MRPSPTPLPRWLDRLVLHLRLLALEDAETHTRAWATPTPRDLERDHRARLHRIVWLLEDGRTDAARREAQTSP